MNIHKNIWLKGQPEHERNGNNNGLEDDEDDDDQHSSNSNVYRKSWISCCRRNNMSKPVASNCFCYCCYHHFRRYHQQRRQQEHTAEQDGHVKRRCKSKITTATTTLIANSVVSPVLILLFLCLQSSSSLISATRILPLWETQIMPSGTGRNIRHLPCVSRRTGETGLCMFAYSCAKANGTHLGTCIDRFYFGSCCKTLNNDIAEFLDPISNNHLNNKEDPSSGFYNKIPADDQSSPGNHVASVTVSVTPNPTSTVSKPVTVLNEYLTSTLNQIMFSTATSNSGSSGPVKTTPVSSVSQFFSGPFSSTYPSSSLSSSSSSSSSSLSSSSSSSSSIVYESIPVTTHKPTMVNSSTSSHHPSSYYTMVSSTASYHSGSYNGGNASAVSIGGIKPLSSSSSSPFYTSTGATFTAKPQSSSSPKPSNTNKPKPKPKPTSKPKPKPTGSPYPPKPVTVSSFSTSSAGSSAQHSTSTSNKYSTTTSPLQQFTSSYLNKTGSPSLVASSSTSTPHDTAHVSDLYSSSISAGTTPKPIRPTASTGSYNRPSSSSGFYTFTDTGASSGGGTVSSTSASTHKYPSFSNVYSTTNEYFNKTGSPVPSQVFGTRPSPSPIGSVSTTSIPPYGTDSNFNNKTDNPQAAHTSSSGTFMSTTESFVIPSDRTKPPVKISMRPSTTYESTTNAFTDNVTGVLIMSSSPFTSSFTSVTLSSVSSAVGGQNSYPTTSSRYPNVTMTIPVASPLPVDPTATAMPVQVSEVETVAVNMSDYKDVCGRRLFPTGRIVGGEKATFGKWPWQISLRQWRTSTYLHKCGAALFNENWAVTAAHCVENVPPSDLLLRLGEHDLSMEEEPYEYQERRVQIVASHPQFDPRTFEYDLALLRFYEPVKFQPNIIPICVPEDDTNFVGSTAHVTGWGRLYEDGPLPSILQEVSVPVINNTVCESMYKSAGYIEHIPEIFICAGWRKGGFDSCEGDSGGPMVIQRPDKRWLLAGIISWGIGCAEPNQPGVYTRISEFRDWINQILQF